MIKSLFTGENIPEGPRPAYLLSKSLMRMLWAQLLDFKYLYLLGTICLILTHYIQSQLPFLAKELADVLSKKQNFEDYWLLVLFSLGIIFFRTFSRLLFFFPARISERDFRKVLINKLEKSTPERYRSMSSGDVFQTVFSDTEQVRAFLGFAVLQFGNVFIACAVLIPQIIKFNSDLLIALLPMAISFILFTVIVGKTRRFQKVALDAQANVQNNIIETYQGKETIKNFHAEDSFVSNFEKLSYKELINFYKTGIGVSFSIPMIPLGVGISLLWGAHIIYQSQMGASSLIVFSGITFLFLEPLAFISWIGVVYIASNAAWGRIRRLVTKIEVESSREQFLNEHNEFGGGLSFNLDFWGKPTPFHIQKDKKLVLVSETGVGKTELVHQIVYCLKKSNYSLGYVSQNPYIFDDTMEKNLFLGNEVTEDLQNRTKKLLEIFKLDDLGHNLDEILKMPLGENGKRLSGGQMKRVCLIRSLLHQHEFLIWDDPFSSIDLIMEGQIIKSLQDLGFLEGKTIILTSHRLSTVRLTDEIIYLKKDEGITVQGKCDELLETSLPLQEFFKEQMVEMN